MPSSIDFFGPNAFYVLLPVGLLVGYVAYSYLFNPLRHIPGPSITRISNIEKLRAGAAADFPKRNLAWHEKYGPLVRIGPDFVSVNDPTAFSQIYGFKQVFSKNPFYGVAEGWYKGKPFSTLITTRDEKYHTLLVKGSKSSYQALSDAGMEQRIQSLVDLALSKISERGRDGQQAVDASALWGQYAFDAMGQTNVSQTFGFLETGTDVQTAMGAIDMANSYFSVIAQAPWMHKFLFGNAFAQKMMEGGNPTLNMGIAAVEKRLRSEQPEAGRDLLAHLLELRLKNSNGLNDDQVLSVVVANIMAGYATVAMALRAITYHLARNPAAYQRLQSEIDNAVTSGAMSQPAKYSEAAKLPYLEAVVTEALRIHPPLGLPLGRVVPEAGVTLAGKHIPGGTVVGINPWVMHRNTDVYGYDADSFRPERWLEADEKKLSEMKRCNISFGGGPRTCQGKDIAMVEIKKLIPALMRRYDFTLANPGQEWKVTGHWFAFQHNMDMVFTPRKY